MKKVVRTVCAIGALFVVFVVIGSSCATLTSAQTEKPRIRVMTFNVLHGGTRLGQPLSRTARAIQEANADIVGLQEIGKSAEELAKILGWNCVRNDWSAIITRFDIVERYKGGVRVKLDSGQEVVVFNNHLKPSPYQPYQLLGIPYGNAPFIKTEREAIASAKKARGGQVADLLKQIDAGTDESVPVFVTGDFNEPSHLDWTEAAAKAGLHPIKVAYPSSQALKMAGFIDALRAVYPDEISKPGFTWTPVTKSDDLKDHHDRIDFVYFKGHGMDIKEVKIVGENKEKADIVISPYPSDHRAVVASFTLSKRPESRKTDANKPDAGDGK